MGQNCRQSMLVVPDILYSLFPWASISWNALYYAQGPP